jgi:hypothetical protein
MGSLKGLSVLAAAIAVAGLFAAQPVRAMTATAQPHPIGFDLGWANRLENIGHRRGWYGYRQGYYRPWRRGWFGYGYPRYAYGYDYPYYGYGNPYYGYGYPYYGYPYAYGGPVVSLGFGSPFWGGPSGFDDDGLK